MNYGITFNGKHSYNDFGLIMEYFKPQPPAPKKIIEDVPFMNGDGYDFSTVGSNGEIVFTGRDIPCRFNYFGKSKEDVELKYMQICEWLLSAGKAMLIADVMPDLYFMAEVQQAPAFDKMDRKGTLDIVFRADTYRQGVNLVGQEDWDTFNFDTDYMQDTDFDVTGSLTVQIYNPGRVISPTVNCNSSMAVTNNGYTANFVSGDNNDYAFKLQPGENNIAITGTGHIAFNFRKELI